MGRCRRFSGCVAFVVLAAVLARAVVAWGQTTTPVPPSVDPGLGSTWCIDFSLYCGPAGQALADTSTIAAEEQLPPLTAGVWSLDFGVGVVLWPVLGSIFLSGDSQSALVAVDECVGGIKGNGGYPRFNGEGYWSGGGALCPVEDLLQYGVYTATSVFASPWNKAFCYNLWALNIYASSATGSLAGWDFPTSSGYPSGMQAAVDTACPSAWRPFYLSTGPAPTAPPLTSIPPLPVDSASQAAYCNVTVGSLLNGTVFSSTFNKTYTFGAKVFAAACNVGTADQPIGRQASGPLLGVTAPWWRFFLNGTGAADGSATGCLFEALSDLAGGNGGCNGGSGFGSYSNLTFTDAASGQGVSLAILAGVAYDGVDPSNPYQWLVTGMVIDGCGGGSSTSIDSCTQSSFPGFLAGNSDMSVGVGGANGGVNNSSQRGAVVNIGQGGGTIVSYPGYPSQVFPGGAPSKGPGVTVIPSTPSPVSLPGTQTQPTIPGFNPSSPPATGVAPPTSVVGNTSPDGNTGTSWLGQVISNGFSWLGNMLANWLALIVQTLQWVGGLVTHLEVAVTNTLDEGFSALETVEADVVTQVEAVGSDIGVETGVLVAGVAEIVNSIEAGSESVVAAVNGVAAPIVLAIGSAATGIEAAVAAISVTVDFSTVVAAVTGVTTAVVALPAEIGTELQAVMVPTSTQITSLETQVQSAVQPTVVGTVTATVTGFASQLQAAATPGSSATCGPSIGYNSQTVSGSVLPGGSVVVPGFRVYLPSGPGCPGNGPGGSQSSYDSQGWDLLGYRDLVRGIIAFGVIWVFGWSVLRSMPWAGRSIEQAEVLGSRVPLGVEVSDRDYFDKGHRQVTKYLREFS